MSDHSRRRARDLRPRRRYRGARPVGPEVPDDEHRRRDSVGRRGTGKVTMTKPPGFDDDATRSPRLEAVGGALHGGLRALEW